MKLLSPAPHEVLTSDDTTCPCPFWSPVVLVPLTLDAGYFKTRVNFFLEEYKEQGGLEIDWTCPRW